MTDTNEMTKQCPYCKSEIPAEAMKCKFCGEFVDKKEDEKSSQPRILVYSGFQFAPKILCPHCQYKGKARFNRPGNGLIEIILRLFLLLPGIIYSIRRRSSKPQRVCPRCKNNFLIEVK